MDDVRVVEVMVRPAETSAHGGRVLLERMTALLAALARVELERLTAVLAGTRRGRVPASGGGE